MVVGRYRVLFTIKGRKVHVLHVRGAYVEAIELHDDEWIEEAVRRFDMAFVDFEEREDLLIVLIAIEPVRYLEC